MVSKNNMNEVIRGKLKHLPKDPGVYEFYNKDQKIIYIGKAKNLRNRIRSYFRSKKHQRAKTISLVSNINDIQWIVVRNEVEALMTEANMIKTHRPRYNIDLKDDKTYPFIRITKEPYPQVLITRKIIRDGSKYYGPFTDVTRLRITLKALYKVFPIRSCSFYLDDKVVNEKRVKLCLDYHIKKCEGPCEGLVSLDHYNNMVDRIESFMRGKTKETELYITQLMKDASSKQQYEEAAIYRDQLDAIRSFREKQSQVATDFEERDVIALAREDNIGVAVIIRIRNGRIFSREKLSLQGLSDKDGKTIQTVITRFYLDSDFIPKEISLQTKPDNTSELKSWLKEKRNGVVYFLYPQKGEKAKELRITMQNAKLLLGEWIINRQKRKEQIPKILGQLQRDLLLDVPPKRIEAFDISHLGGTNTVASMVCFIDAKSRKTEYRKFNIKNVSGIDDFTAMREVVFRRYKRLKEEEKQFPDLILIDGGKGQVSMALSALRELGLDYIPVIGLAKKLEEVFVPGNPEAQSIHKQSPGLILLQRIRDEAHRFAITFHRNKRNRDLVMSIFADIPGMGKKRLSKLLQQFDGARAIAKLTPKVINRKTGIPIKIGQEVVKVAKMLKK